MNNVELSINAHIAVTKAIRDGDLIRPALCDLCGKPQQFGRVLEGHHDDYSKPLTVLWLRYPCHKQRHKQLKGK